MADSVGAVGLFLLVMVVVLAIPRQPTLFGCVWRFALVILLGIAVIGGGVVSVLSEGQGVAVEGILDPVAAVGLVFVGMAAIVLYVAKMMLGGVSTDDGPVIVEGEKTRSLGCAIVVSGIVCLCIVLSMFAAMLQR